MQLLPFCQKNKTLFSSLRIVGSALLKRRVGLNKMNIKQIINFILICCSVLSAGISLSLLSPFYPKVALSKGVSVTQSGLVLGSVFLSTVLFTPFFGKYLQVIGARRSLIFGFIIVALGNICFAFLERVQNTVTFLILSDK